MRDQILGRDGPPLRLRRAEPQDAEAVCDVYRLSIHVLCAGHYRPDQLEAWASGLDPQAFREALILPEVVGVVVEHGDEVLGFALLQGPNVRALYVRPDASGQGVGTTLLRALESEAALRLAPVLCLFASLNSRAFYEANGFQSLGRTTHPLTERVSVECFEMEKSLQAPRPRR